MLLSTNLFAYWKLDEGTGNQAFTAIDAADATANGNTLTQVNQPGSAAGMIGNARVFDPSFPQRFGSANTSAFGTGIGNTDFTLQAWVNINDKTASRSVLGA